MDVPVLNDLSYARGKNWINIGSVALINTTFTFVWEWVKECRHAVN